MCVGPMSSAKWTCWASLTLYYLYYAKLPVLMWNQFLDLIVVRILWLIWHPCCGICRCRTKVFILLNHANKTESNIQVEATVFKRSYPVVCWTQCHLQIHQISISKSWLSQTLYTFQFPNVDLHCQPNLASVLVPIYSCECE